MVRCFSSSHEQIHEDDSLDHGEMERCFALLMEAGCDGMIVAGSLGEGPMLSHDEKLEVLKTAQKRRQKQAGAPDHQRSGTRDGAALAKRAAKAGADGLMLVPSPIYHTDPEETVTTLKAVAAAGDLPVMIYSNRIAYRVDVTSRRSWQNLRRTSISSRSRNPRTTFAARQISSTISATGIDLFTGVDNLAFEALTGRRDRLGCRPGHRLPEGNCGDLQAGDGRPLRDEALEIYRWFRPLLDLDVSTYLVQNIKLAEVHEIGTNDRVRLPRQPLRASAAHGCREDRQGRDRIAAETADFDAKASRLNDGRPTADQEDIVIIGAGIVGICRCRLSCRGWAQGTCHRPAGHLRGDELRQRRGFGLFRYSSAWPPRAFWPRCRAGLSTRSGRFPFRPSYLPKLRPGCTGSGAPAAPTL